LADRPNPHLPPSPYHLRAVWRIAVLGGGVTGLSAAYALARARLAGAPIEESLIEARDRLGGSIQTERVGEFLVEGGPDSFLTEKPEAAALCRELGLGHSLLGSNDVRRRTYILHRGRLVPLPDGLMLLVPTRIGPMLTTPLLPFRSKLAVAAEFFARPSKADNGAPDDESVASFVGRHFGDAMTENIVDPLLAGVFGGDASALSVRSVLPRFYTMEQKHGSLTGATLNAMRQRRSRAQASANANEAAPTLFMTLRDGLGRMVEALEQRLNLSRVFLGQPVLAIEPYERACAGRAYRVRCEGGTVHDADAVILALPTYQCARLISSFDPSLAQSFGAIAYSSAMTVALGYDPARAGLAQLPPGFGFLVPRQERRRLLACTFVQGKFNYRAPPGRALLRCFLGGSRDPEVLNLSDKDTVDLCRRELRVILNLDAEPLFYRIYRWPQSMPQYEVGHSQRVDAILRQLENHPGFFVAGNAYSGIGISDCIRTGKAAAQSALKMLNSE
jgi:protoporphyrinogen/coproporphyrinogen III oxidase